MEGEEPLPGMNPRGMAQEGCCPVMVVLQHCYCLGWRFQTCEKAMPLPISSCG